MSLSVSLLNTHIQQRQLDKILFTSITIYTVRSGSLDEVNVTHPDLEAIEINVFFNEIIYCIYTHKFSDI